MNNNYNTKRRLNDNIYLELKDKMWVNLEFENYRCHFVWHSILFRYDDTSSDSEFSDGFDSRLDEDFNEMISQIRKKRKVDEQQLGNYTEELIETHIEPIENGASVKKISIVNVQCNKISISTANESYDVDSSVRYDTSENGTTVEKISVNSTSVCVEQEPIEMCQSIENGVAVEKTSVVNETEEIQDIPKRNRTSIANE